ncbi:disintegrin and metalloproteinase domain-containing protein 12-like [Pteropus medius]|uniref:disintegrin and metalloproteinase domain-containing protein 12-like n=1 Tax=Pteropus vampyrus TaxID=132908 RepID=UPI00196B28E7|nr:disintegrin and metalloproteinase domain-containing protein 12-like [Pteropus giganteus]
MLTCHWFTEQVSELHMQQAQEQPGQQLLVMVPTGQGREPGNCHRETLQEGGGHPRPEIRERAQRKRPFCDNRGVTIGLLVTVLCLLAAGFVVYLKRKTLIPLLFTDKKSAIEKLRCVRPPRPSSGSQPGQAHLTHLGKGLLRKPPHSSAPRDNPKRPLQCLNVDISRPLKALDFPQPRPPPRVLPPLHQAPRAPGVPARPLPANPAPRQAQGTRKPDPPQKPLPANPLSKTTRLASALARTPEQQASGLRLVPLRAAPECPRPGPRATHVAYAK